MIGALVETKELLQTVGASLVAGVGITATFSVMIFGATRFADQRRHDRPLAAAAFGGLAILAMAASLGGIALGIIVMLSK